ncbi:MAG: hypothetical protein ABIR37_01820 [Candidatus Saccharimonadales bacterium]
MPKTLIVTGARHHHVRTVFASLCGTMAVSLLFTSVLLVWLNHTLTNSTTYNSIVGPLAEKPEIQYFVAEQASQQIVKSAPIIETANTLLPPDVIVGKTPEQLQPLVKAKVYTAVLQIVRAPQFANVWKQTNITAHQALVTQLTSSKPQAVTLDLSPIITTVIEQLKQTELAPVASQLTIDPAAAKLDLKGGIIDKAAAYYQLFQKLLIGLIALVVVLLVLAVVASVHHLKTLRRILIVVGVIALLLAVMLEAPSFIYVGGSTPVEQKAVAQIARSLFHDLQLFSLWAGLACIAAALGSKIYTIRTATPKK